jgi:hypothetical protein
MGVDRPLSGAASNDFAAADLGDQGRSSHQGKSSSNPVAVHTCPQAISPELAALNLGQSVAA